MAEQKKTDPSKKKQLTDKELEELLHKSEQKTDFPDVTFDEFTPPTHDEWVEACNVLLKGKPFDKIMFTKNYEGITFDPIYTLADSKPILPTDDYPGMGDYLRGSTVNGYVHQPWGIAQPCDLTLPVENNKLLKHELDKGSTMYNIRLDSAAKDGVDVADAAAPGDEGMSVTTVEDMHTALNGLDLKKTALMMYAGPSAGGMLALTAAALKADGKKADILHGVIGADPIGELVKRGSNPAALDTLLDEMAESIKWAKKNAPQLRTIFVRSEVFTDGGANCVQEVAYTFATAVAYIRAMVQRGLSVKDVAHCLQFELNQGANFFMEISKLRAAREVWANIMEAFGAEEADRAMVVHGRPSKFTKAVFDPYVNMLRNTTQTFSSVVGGVNTYENEPFDEPIRKGDEFSRRIARNVNVILQEELGMLRPIDPAGGSWAVETLTKQMAEKIWAEFQEVEKLGGILKALEAGYPQKQIAAILADRFKKLDFRKDRAVGVNMYPNMTEELLDPKPEDRQAEKKVLTAAVEAYRKDIDEKFLKTALAELQKSKQGEVIDNATVAFAAGATIGEVWKTFTRDAKSVKIDPIVAHHWTERFEALRMDTEKYKKKTGKNVEIFLANMGPIPQHKARADFSTSFLQVGEFNVNLNDGFKDDDKSTAIEKCCKAAAEKPYDCAVICSTDATYPEIVPALAPKLKAALPKGATLFLAGAAPKDLVPVYKAAGVDDFVSVAANCYEILRMLQKKKGMIE